MAALSKAQEAWGENMPDWIEVLAQACDATSQNQVARRIERSAALVSNVLAQKYTGDMAAVEDLVRGVFMKQTVTCPVLGELGLQTCRKWRGRAGRFQNVNSQYVTMYRACIRCPIRLKEDASDADAD